MRGTVMLKTILQIRKLLTGRQKSLAIQPGPYSSQEWENYLILKTGFSW